MSTKLALQVPLPSGGLRYRQFSRAAASVVKPLAKFVNVPAVQDFAHAAQELVIALKVSTIGCFLVAGADVDQPRAIQAPGVNDDVARAILTRIEKLVALIVNAIETMDLMDTIDTRVQLEKLRSFTG
jgi:hypothetical protein